MNQIVALPDSAPIRWQRAPLTAADYQALSEAMELLEHPGLTAKLSNYIGMPVEKALAMLPENLAKPVTLITREALSKAMDAALLTLPPEPSLPSASMTHKVLAGLSGALGGSFGIASLAVELPVSATLMLRAIAAIAREHGEDLSDPKVKLACMEVFAMGGKSSSDDNTEVGYYAVRAFLSKTVEESAKHVLHKGMVKEGAPALVKFINAVAQRFSVQVSQKFALQSLPAIGAVGGASVNVVFLSHFQNMARAHFTVRRLERIYGSDRIRQVYASLESS